MATDTQFRAWLGRVCDARDRRTYWEWVDAQHEFFNSLSHERDRQHFLASGTLYVSTPLERINEIVSAVGLAHRSLPPIPGVTVPDSEWQDDGCP